MMMDASEYTFPFEGNWNCDSRRRAFHEYVALNTLSRLKGIETGYLTFL